MLSNYRYLYTIYALMLALTQACITSSHEEIQQKEFNQLNCPVQAFEPTIKVSKNLALQLGFVECQNDLSYSVVKRTSNEGKTWELVGPHVAGARSQHVHFQSDKIGYLLVSHYVGGPGPELLYKTKDSGNTWNFVTRMEKGDEEHTKSIVRFCVKSNTAYYSTYHLQTDQIVYASLHLPTNWHQTINKNKFPCKGEK